MADGRMRVWRRPGERFADNCVVRHDRFGGGSIHVWAGITANNKTQLVVLDRAVTAQVYCDDVLTPIAIPFMQQHLRNGIFQQDNARPHTARLTMALLRANNINVMDWPSLSPDLAPIEHVWDALGKRVREHNPTDVNQLRNALLQEWQNMPQNVIRTIVYSMRRRCQACINANGGYTRY